MTVAVVPFGFQEVQLREACWVNGRPHFTRRSIGEWLGYPRPHQAIGTIINRHPHLRDSRWSVVLKLRTTDGKEYDQELFDPIGLQLIVFEFHQPKAIQFKVAAANLVWAYFNGQLKPYKEPPPELAPALALPRYSRARGQAIREIIAAHGWSIGKIRYRIRRLEAGLPPAPVVRRGMHYIHCRYRAVRPKALALRRQGQKFREIAAALRIPLSTVHSWTQKTEPAPQLAASGPAPQEIHAAEGVSP